MKNTEKPYTLNKVEIYTVGREFVIGLMMNRLM
jgi:hypothetical protein